MLLIRGQFSHSKAKTRRIAPNINESDNSLDFHVVIGMERPKVIISFAWSKVGFHLTWLRYKKEKEKKSYFIFIYLYIYTNRRLYIPA